MTEFGDENNKSDQASTPKLSEKKEVNEGDDKACEVEDVEEITIGADNQDLIGASDMAIPVGEEPLSEEKRDAGLTLMPSEKSHPEGSDAVFSTTIRKISVQPEPVEKTVEPAEKSKEDDKKIGKEKEDHPIIPKHRITITESCAPPGYGEEITQNKEFLEEAGLKCLDVIISATEQEKASPVELQPGVTTEKDFNGKAEHDEDRGDEREEDEEVSLLEKETQCMANQDGRAPMEPGKEIMANREEVKINVPSSATDEIEQERASPVKIQLAITTEEDLNEKTEHDEEMEDERGEEKAPSLEKETHCTENQDGRGPTEPENEMMTKREEREEVEINVPSTVQHSDVAMVDFSAKDLLSFAWQIAQGMVGIKQA